MNPNCILLPPPVLYIISNIHQSPNKKSRSFTLKSFKSKFILILEKHPRQNLSRSYFIKNTCCQSEQKQVQMSKNL